MNDLRDLYKALQEERDNLSHAEVKSSSKLVELEKKSEEMLESLEKVEEERKKAEEFGEKTQKEAQDLWKTLQTKSAALQAFKLESEDNTKNLETRLDDLSGKHEALTEERDGLQKDLANEKEANSKLIDDKETSEKMLRQAQAVRTFLQDECPARRGDAPSNDGILGIVHTMP